MPSVYERRIYEVDTLRGLAALIIFLFHCELILPPTHVRLFNFGVTGVDLFFIISGFVILLTLERTDNWVNFIINRLAKLYPTYWVCVSITAALILINSKHSLVSASNLLVGYLGNLTMFQRFAGITNLDEQYWTLEVEMLFYIVMLFIFIVKKLKEIERISYVIITFVVVYDIFLEIHFSLNRYFILVDHFPLFLAGILFYKIKSQGGSLARYLGIAYCFVATIILFNNGGRSMFYISLTEYTVMLAIYFLLFFLLAFNRLAFIARRPLIFIGKVSYGFYLIHQYLSTQIIIPTLQKHFSMNFYVNAVFAFGASFFLASLITVYIEQPIVKYWKRGSINKILNKRNPHVHL